MYYIYCYRDPESGYPFYIGKGKGNRYKYHLYEAKCKDDSEVMNKLKFRKIRKILDKGLEPLIEIVCNGLELEESYTLERMLVQYYGRIDNNTGILTNLTDGGDGPLKRTAWNKGYKFQWITKDGCDKQIDKSDIASFLDQGWEIGRSKERGKTAWNKGKSIPGLFSERNQSGKLNPNSRGIIWMIITEDEVYINNLKKEILKEANMSLTVIDRMFRKKKYLKNKHGVKFVFKIKLFKSLKSSNNVFV